MSGILNLDEAIVLRAHLSNAPQPGTTGRVHLTLDSGAVFSSTFAFP
jgi:hypothetical protein